MNNVIFEDSEAPMNAYDDAYGCACDKLTVLRCLAWPRVAAPPEAAQPIQTIQPPSLQIVQPAQWLGRIICE